VTSIGWGWAFYGCSGLTDLTIGNGVGCIPMGTFDSCAKLTNVTIPNSVTNIGWYAFECCSNLTSVILPASVTNLYDDWFWGCDSLREITVDPLNPAYASVGGVLYDKTLTTLVQCTAGKEGAITIPGTVTSIGNMALTGCAALKAITVDASNPVYSSLDGVLFNRDQTTLLKCPRGKIGDYTVPGSATGIESRAFFGCATLTNIDIPNSVTSIGSWAFEQCSGLSSITIPTGVSSIEEWTFAGCGNLTSVILGNGVNSIGRGAFYGCRSLTGVTLGEVSSIDEWAFAACSSLTSVSIPDSIYSIGSMAFASCSSLTAVYFEGDAPEFLGQSAFEETSATIYYLSGTSGWGPTFGGRPTALWGAEPVPFNYIVENGTITITGYTGPGGDVLIPETIMGLPVIRVGENAFYGCTSVTGITMPNSVTSIGERAFSGCENLTSIDFGHGVTSIGGGAFEYCTSLASVVLPSSVTDIGTAAFYECTGLISAMIDNSVISIGAAAFYHCSSLSSITIPDSVTSLGSEGFIGCTNLTSATMGNGISIIEEHMYQGCSSLTNVTIPDSVTSIRQGAFYNCSSLIGIEIPDSVRVIEESAFSWCTGLTGIRIPASVIEIGEGVFIHCTSLNAISVDPLNPAYTSVDGVLFNKSKSMLLRYPVGNTGSRKIPDNVTTIGSGAFAGCLGLTDIQIPASVKTIGRHAFARCTGLTSVTIPDTVTTLRLRTFEGCTGLSNVIMPISLTSIELEAFSGCSALSSITIPYRVISIGYRGFHDCTSLSAVYFWGSAPDVDGAVFEGTGATIYYLPHTSGWGPLFAGRPTMPWGVVWGSPVLGDVDGNEVVDRNDLDLVAASRNQPAVNADDPRDLDGDGRITVLDARILVTLFSVPGGFLHATSSPQGVVLEWNDGGAGGTSRLQSTTDLQSGNWQDVGGLQSSTNTVIGTSAERMFFRLVLPE